MAKSGMNPKTLQYIMGHSDISVTLNTYSYVHFDDAKEELLRVVQKQAIGTDWIFTDEFTNFEGKNIRKYKKI
ncbi:hypothetical protein [Clostridium sp.]|uniref:hypothetical protein n=1 Tax=Clostridium sp. TaxID=1506 RepID=UPI0037C116F9